MSERGEVRIYNVDTGRGVIVPTNDDISDGIAVDHTVLADGLALLRPGQRVRFSRKGGRAVDVALDEED